MEAWLTNHGSHLGANQDTITSGMVEDSQYAIQPGVGLAQPSPPGPAQPSPQLLRALLDRKPALQSMPSRHPKDHPLPAEHYAFSI